MFKKFWFLFLVLIIEGASLMAVEIMGAKLLAPFYGSSLYVWTAILCITVLGLTFGYYIGGQLSKKHSSEKNLIIILSISALLVFVLPNTASAVIYLTSKMGLITGICIASFLLLVPPMLGFGLVGPFVVKLMSHKIESVGKVAGTVYFTSTFGGIIATFLFGFYFIPELGLKFSALLTALALSILPIVFFLKTIFLGNKSKISSSVIQNETVLKAKVVSKSIKSSSKIKQIKNSFYLFAAIEGATVMAVELIAARMLAPYFGSSLYVWVTVIGITLLSLALGYFFGGILADKYPDINTIYRVLLIAASFLLFMHYFSQYLTLAFLKMDIITEVIIVSILLILPPLLFLGMLPTLLIRYLTAKFDNAGATTGKVFTISSASGIIALPIIGFFIIPNYGLTMPSIIIGLLVGIIPFIKLLSQKKYSSLLFVFFIILSFSQQNKISSSPNIKVLEYSEGLMGQMLVADFYYGFENENTNNRFLFLNRIGQSAIDNTSSNALGDYINYSISIASILPENSNALLLGLGGGSVAKILKNILLFNVDAVELDERIAKVAKKYFSLNLDTKVIIDDARHYIETTKKTYDLIYFDVFRGDLQPQHVLNLECFVKAKSLLNKNGLIIINFNGFLTGEIGKSGRYVYSTLLAAGLDTKILPTPGNEEDRNTIFIASVEPQDFHQLRFPLYYQGKLVNLDSIFVNSNALNLKDVSVFTDDKSNLDRLNIEANNNWRKYYNETFTKSFLDNGVPLFK